MTRFAEYSLAWLKQRKITSRTRENYSKILHAHVLPRFADKDLCDISPDAVQIWYANISPDAPTVRNHAYVLLRSILGSALADGLIGGNPCRIEGVSTSGRIRAARPTTQDDLESIGRAMPPAYQLLVLMAVGLAMRFSELSELRRKDIDLARGVVRVRRAVMLIDGKFEVSTPKSAGGIRDIGIPPRLLAAVEAHLQVHVSDGAESLLFPAVDDPERHLAPRRLYSMFNQARKVAGQSDVTITDLRHFAGGVDRFE